MPRRQLSGRGLIKRPPPTSMDASNDNPKRSIPNDFYRDFASQKISDAEDTEPTSTDISTTEDSEEDDAPSSLNEHPSTSHHSKCQCERVLEGQQTLQTTINDVKKRQNDLQKALLLEVKMLKDSLVEEMRNVRDSVARLIDYNTQRILVNQNNIDINEPDQDDLFVPNNVTANDEGYFHR